MLRSWKKIDLMCSTDNFPNAFDVKLKWQVNIILHFVRSFWYCDKGFEVWIETITVITNDLTSMIEASNKHYTHNECRFNFIVCQVRTTRLLYLFSYSLTALTHRAKVDLGVRHQMETPLYPILWHFTLIGSLKPVQVFLNFVAPAISGISHSFPYRT